MKLGTILLSFTILFQSFNIEIGDVLKISKLIDHITCHIEQGDDMLVFFDLHYGDKVALHKDKHKEHNELPFKHQHIDIHIQYLHTILEEKIAESYTDLNTVKNNFSYKDPHTNSFINSFFQPPQK